MKKKLVILSTILISFIIILIIVLIFNSKKATLERRFDIDLPKDCDIEEYTKTPFSVWDSNITAAKIVIKKTDFESFSDIVYEKYEFYTIPQDISDDEEIFPPGAGFPINHEGPDSDLPWWDLETSDIDCFWYLSEENPYYKTLGKRYHYLRRIYAVELEEEFVLYFFSMI